MNTTAPIRHILLRAFWILLRAWGACVASYLLGIVLIATVVESLTLSGASVAAYVLVAVEVVVTLAAIAWTHARLVGLLQPLARWFCVLAFALLQLGTCGIAAITTLLALNR
ncbi:MAG: hypothetical protein WAW34_11590 [Rhodoferax sp.]|jgi:hypothetical protein